MEGNNNPIRRVRGVRVDYLALHGGPEQRQVAAPARSRPAPAPAPAATSIVQKQSSPQIDVLKETNNLLPRQIEVNTILFNQCKPQHGGVGQYVQFRVRRTFKMREQDYIVRARADKFWGFGVGTTTVPRRAELIELYCEVRCACNTGKRHYPLIFLSEAKVITEDEFLNYKHPRCARCGEGSESDAELEIVSSGPEQKKGEKKYEEEEDEKKNKEEEEEEDEEGVMEEENE